MTDAQRETLVLVGAILLSLVVTSAVIFLAMNSTDAAERNLLIGGLIGTPAFGGGMLAGYGLGQSRRTGTGPGGPTVDVDTNTADVRVVAGSPPAPPPAARRAPPPPTLPDPGTP